MDNKYIMYIDYDYERKIRRQTGGVLNVLSSSEGDYRGQGGVHACMYVLLLVCWLAEWSVSNRRRRGLGLSDPR